MRAMPSPIWMTVPTSSTLACDLVALDLGLQDVGDLVWSQLHASLPTGKGVRMSARRISSSRRRTDASRRTPRALRTRPPMIAGSTVATTLASWPTAAESRSRRFVDLARRRGPRRWSPRRSGCDPRRRRARRTRAAVSATQRQPAVVGQHERGVSDERARSPRAASASRASWPRAGSRGWQARAGAAGSRPAPSSSAFRSASTSRVRPASLAAAYSASAYTRAAGLDPLGHYSSPSGTSAAKSTSARASSISRFCSRRVEAARGRPSRSRRS